MIRFIGVGVVRKKIVSPTHVFVYLLKLSQTLQSWKWRTLHLVEEITLRLPILLVDHTLKLDLVTLKLPPDTLKLAPDTLPLDRDTLQQALGTLQLVQDTHLPVKLAINLLVCQAILLLPLVDLVTLP